MTQSVTKLKPITFSAIFAALGACVQTIEGYIPSSLPLPGGRLGLSNIVTMVILKVFGVKYALSVAVLKSVISVLLSGRATAFVYSLVGGIVSVFAMYLADKYIKSTTGIGRGIIGAWANNIAQTAVGTVIMSNIYILSYAFVLGPVSVVTGAFTGFISDLIGRKMVKWGKD